MHQEPAHLAMAAALALVAAAMHATGEANGARLLSVKGEFGRVVQNQDRPCRRADTLTRGVEMPAQNIVFAHAFVGEEAVGGLRVCPILTGQWNAFAHGLLGLLNKLAEPLR